MSAPLITFTSEYPVYWLDRHLPARTPGGRPIARGPSCAAGPEVLSQVAAGQGVPPVAARAEEFHARPGTTFVTFGDAPPSTTPPCGPPTVPPPPSGPSPHCSARS